MQTQTTAAKKRRKKKLKLLRPEMVCVLCAGTRTRVVDAEGGAHREAPCNLCGGGLPC